MTKQELEQEFDQLLEMNIEKGFLSRHEDGRIDITQEGIVEANKVYSLPFISIGEGNCITVPNAWIEALWCLSQMYKSEGEDIRKCLIRHFRKIGMPLPRILKVIAELDWLEELSSKNGRAM